MLELLKRVVSNAGCKPLVSNDPFRLQGNGVDFRCKLIGVRELPYFSRDNGMPPEVLCFEQMLIAKDAAEHSGFHKRKIILNVSIAGVKIKDAKCGAELYSFVATSIPFLQLDARDPRAFSFIVLTPSGHKLYAVKTLERAEPAVRTIDQMFQIAFGMNGGRVDGGVPVADLLDFNAASPTSAKPQMEPFVRPNALTMDSGEAAAIARPLHPASPCLRRAVSTDIPIIHHLKQEDFVDDFFFKLG